MKLQSQLNTKFVYFPIQNHFHILNIVIQIWQVFIGYGFYKKTITGPFNLHKTFFNLKMEYEICRMCIWKYIFILFFTNMWKAYTYPFACVNDIVIIYYASFFPSAMLRMVGLGPMKVLCPTCFSFYPFIYYILALCISRSFSFLLMFWNSLK